MFLGPEYLQHERLTALKNSSIPTTNKNMEISGLSVEIVSTSSSEPHQRIHPASEDELSAISAGIILGQCYQHYLQNFPRNLQNFLSN